MTEGTAVAATRTKEEIESWLVEQVARLAGVAGDEVDQTAPLTSMGISSLRLLRLRARIFQKYGVEPPLTADSIRQAVDFVVAAEAGTPAPLPVPSTAGSGERRDPFPLTDIQHAYYVGRGDALPLGGVGCHTYYEFDLPAVDVSRLELAWQKVIDRHEMLRAVVVPGGQQRVLDQTPPYRFEFSDLSGESPESSERRLAALREAMSHEVLEPERWPLFRIACNKLPGETVRLHVSIDLLIADLWSIRILFRDWWRFYEEPAAVIPAPELTFRDCVLEALRNETSPVHKQSKKYWNERVSGLPSAPQLPVLGEGAPLFRQRKARLGPERWADIAEQAALHGVTPSVALLTAYASVLAKWSRSQQLTVDVTLFNRPLGRAGAEEVVGDFTAVDLLGVDLRQDTFAAAAQEIQRQLWRDLEHASAGGVKLLRDLAASSGAAPGALMPVVFTSDLGNGDGTDSASHLFSGFGQPIYAISQTPQVHLDHQVYEDADGVTLVWDSREGAFPEGLLDDMFGVYRGLVEGLAAPEGWSGAVGVGLPEWQLRVRAAANDTAGPVPSEVLCRRVLERCADEAFAGRPAVVAPDRQLSFGELGRAVVGVAQELAEAGFGRRRVVGVALSKGWRQVVAALGASAAGCVYVPIDPELPVARRQWLIGHAGVECLLLAPDADRAQWPADMPAVTVGGRLASVDEVARWQCPAEPEDVAYVIYTSGSTGTPKGVAVSHRAAVNTLVDVAERFGVGADDRVLGLSSLSFDLSVFDVFGMLGVGGALVLPEPAARRDPARWLELVDRHRVTVWNSVPALMEMFVEYCEGAHGGEIPLRVALLSGDWIPLSLPDWVCALARDCQVISLGGATEAAVWSIAYPVGRVEESWSSIPYGRPLRNQTFEILDERLEPVPVWVPGDLYIGGIGLAECYWNDPERTAESFIRQPADGRRLYRTGDLGRYLPDGTIEFLGRQDFQVKIGGYRIELGEIEHALTQAPGVGQAAVTAHGPRTNQRLTAYVTAVGQHDDVFLELCGEVETDPLARLQFKLSQPALRALDGHTVTLPEADRISLPPGSCRAYRAEPVSRDDFAALLSVLRQCSESSEGALLPRRTYASAGGLYPVQTYLLVKEGRVAGVPGGTYYYDPAAHALVRCKDVPALPEGTVAAANREIVAGAAFTIFLVADLGAIRPLYGTLSRDFCLLEAGLVAQRLQDCAHGVGLGTCHIGGTLHTPELHEALRLDKEHELLHVMVGGAPARQAPPRTGGFEAKVRDHLAQVLPAYMVPSTIRVLEQMPLTSQGKLDRKALARDAEVSRTDMAQYVEPSGNAEATVADVLCEVLGVERVGATDNFFELGATSVKLTAAHARIQERLGREFSLLVMFEHTTTRTLATWLEGKGTAAPEASTGQRARLRREAQLRRRKTTNRSREEEQ